MAPLRSPARKNSAKTDQILCAKARHKQVLLIKRFSNNRKSLRHARRQAGMAKIWVQAITKEMFLQAM